MNKPIILLGGGGNVLSLPRYNGGVKVLNLWAKLLRKYDYESYLVTQNGNYDKWLIEHQPVISFDLAKKWKKEKRIKCVTTWLPIARYLLELTDELYFYDCEIAYTSRSHFPLLKELMQSKRLQAVATNSHTNQEWYQVTLQYPPPLINEWSDETYWRPKSEMRQENLIGYMNEPGGSSEDDIKKVDTICRENNIQLEFACIAGNEQMVLDKMRRCDFFLGTNPGKHPIYGEGCPRTGNEAMHAGCIVIAYDVNGNREYIKNGVTGFLVEKRKPELLAEKLIHLIKNPKIKEQIRIHSVDFALREFSSPGRWEVIRNFLGLE